MGLRAAAAIALALAAASAAPAASEPAAERAEKETCGSRSMADFPGAFTDPGNLVVGPLVLMGAGGTPEYVKSYGGQKFPLLVRNGRKVRVALPRSARPGAGLGWGRLPGGRVEAHEANRVVRFAACPRGRNSGSSADGRAVTFWSGGVLVDSPRCVPLRVQVGRGAVRDAEIQLGADCP